jgi:hypothetical protein
LREFWVREHRAGRTAPVTLDPVKSASDLTRVPTGNRAQRRAAGKASKRLKVRGGVLRGNGVQAVGWGLKSPQGSLIAFQVAWAAQEEAIEPPGRDVDEVERVA